MSNDSTDPGYLTPAGTEPDYDRQLENQIVLWISGVSGLPVSAIYPRWTDPQSSIPKNGITWCGFGVTTLPRDDMPADIQGDDLMDQWTWENVTVLACFYGPQGAATAARFRDGLYVEQNNTTLRTAAGLSLVGTGRIYNLPELINNQWVRRYDLTVTLSRKNIRTYNVKSILIPNVDITPGD
ncbi:phage neck terminator protein [Phytobacter ursingii]